MLDTPVLCILHSSQVSIFSGEVQPDPIVPRGKTAGSFAGQKESRKTQKSINRYAQLGHRNLFLGLIQLAWDLKILNFDGRSGGGGGI
jgi:hypothetical protein